MASQTTGAMTTGAMTTGGVATVAVATGAIDRLANVRGRDWNELALLVARAGSNPRRLTTDEIRRVGLLYRATAADLAQARRIAPGDAVTRRLEVLVNGGRTIVYARAPRTNTATGFLAQDYWRLVAKRARWSWTATLLLVGSGLVMFLWALQEPARAAGVVGFDVTQLRTSADDFGLSAAEESGLSAGIFVNNIRVSVTAFALGMTFGIGSVLLLVFNGALLGAVTGAAFAAGNGSVVLALVVPHGVLELSIIVVACAVGMSMGAAIVDPGVVRRGPALIAEARDGALIVLGTMPWFVIAGLVEGFVTPTGLGLPAAMAVGVGLGGLYWLLVWRLGGRRVTPTGTKEPQPAVRGVALR